MSTEDRTRVAVNERDVRKVAAVSLVGASVEWFDFFLFGTAAALVFPTLFFPSEDPVTAVMSSFVVFGIAFLARPLGGIVWGHYGDRIGRKKAFIAALATMSVASFLIGLLPTFEAVGPLAPVLLTVLRFVQGLAVGGQWGGAALMATESAPADRRGFYGSFAQLGVPIGVLLGLSGYFLLFQLLGPEAFAAFGWRIPFLASILFVGVVIYTNARLEETPAFQTLRRASAERSAGAPHVRRAPLVEVLRRHGHIVLLGGGAFIVVNMVFYLYMTFLLDYGIRVLGLDMGGVLLPITIAVACLLPALPLFGALSDRIGRNLVYIAGAALTGVWAFPAFWLIDTRSFWGITAALVVGMIFLALMYGPLAAFLGELFPPEIRYSGASLGYQLGAVVGGSATPAVAVALLASTGTNASVAWLVIALAVVAIVCVFILQRMGTARKRELSTAEARA